MLNTANCLLLTAKRFHNALPPKGCIYGQWPTGVSILLPEPYPPREFTLEEDELHPNLRVCDITDYLSIKDESDDQPQSKKDKVESNGEEKDKQERDIKQERDESTKETSMEQTENKETN